MPHLFEIINRRITPNIETLLIPPFKDIWERDKTLDKENATKELAYIELSTSMAKNNPYREYKEDIKKSKIKEHLKINPLWKEDNLITEGLQRVREMQEEGSATYSLYMTAKTVKEKFEKELLNLDITEKNQKTGNPLYKPKDITSALLDIDKVAASLDALSKKLEEDLFESSRKKGGKEISTFADPDSL